jgi:hypothetical protein
VFVAALNTISNCHRLPVRHSKNAADRTCGSGDCAAAGREKFKLFRNGPLVSIERLRLEATVRSDSLRLLAGVAGVRGVFD